MLGPGPCPDCFTENLKCGFFCRGWQQVEGENFACIKESVFCGSMSSSRFGVPWEGAIPGAYLYVDSNLKLPTESLLT
jgi:hypothetical protein